MRRIIERETARSPWRFFPLAMAGALVLVMAVNAGMVWSALNTFPGAAQNDGFDESNAYNHILAAVERQNALGWQVAADTLSNGRAVLHLKDRNGQPLTGAKIEANAIRPIGPVHATRLQFLPTEDGSYLADMALPLRGQWDLMVHAVRAGQEYRVTRRVLVK
jgi:nitrogen fixation protein FixH